MADANDLDYPEGRLMDVARAHRRAQLEQEAAALDRLHNSVMQTHSHATRINVELQDQDRLLGTMNRNLDAAGLEVRDQTRSVGQIIERSGHGCFFLTVAILVLIIIILLSI